MKRTIVTTSHKPDSESVILGKQAAIVLNTLFAEREKMSLNKLRQKYMCENVLVVKDNELTLHTELGEYFFHPSMSVPRIKGIREGKNDHMVDAMNLQPGEVVLDCTLGLGSDSVVAAFATGPSGKVVGLEYSPEIALIVKHGLHYSNERRAAVREAMTRIEVVNIDYSTFLAEQDDNSFDIVYFDPMFRFPRRESSSMQPLRKVVNPEPVPVSAVKQAVRVARRRVVMKENWFSKEFERLGFTHVVGGKYSPVAFGIIDKEEAG